MKYFLVLCLAGLCRAMTVPTPSTLYDCEYCQPEQIHISFGENVNDMVITWSTPYQTDSFAHYGVGSLNQLVKGSEWWFVDGGLNKNKQMMHRVELKYLEYNTTYWYNVGSEYGWSDLHSFKTPPKGEDWVVSAAIYGDLGLENAHSVPYLQNDAEQGLYDFVLHVGDFAYDLASEDATVGDQFMRMIQPIASIVPYMVCPGNHEAAYNFSNYRNRFSMPGPFESLYYSWNIGPIHFVSFSTEFYFGNHDTDPHWFRWLKQQFYWIRNDLTEATKTENRAKRPWIIMYAHRPMYCSSRNNECPWPDVPQRAGEGLPEPGYGIEPLLKDFGVDLIIFGHEHAYERMFPLYNYTVYNGTSDNPYLNPVAPVHLITGSAGCKKQTYIINNNKPYTAFSSSDYGYTKFKAYNKTHLYLEQVSVDQNGQVIDSFWLIRERHEAYKL